jgi:hypothetical protein
MKHQPIMIAALLTVLLGFSVTANAGYFNDRHHQQRYRIQHGIANGQITPGEAQKLFRDQRQVRQLRRHYLSDGKLSPREQRILYERLQRSSKRIYHYKHNTRRVEPPWYADHRVFFFSWR